MPLPNQTSSAASIRIPTAANPLSAGSAPGHIQLVQSVTAIWTARAIYAAARLQIADILGDSQIGVAELAERCATHPPSLYRLLRALAGLGILTEAAPRQFALTELGRALKINAPGAARAAVLTLAGDWQWRAWDNFVYSLETGEPGLRAHCGQDLFDYLASHPEDARNFDQAMVGLYAGLGQTVLEHYDFSNLTKIADLGGGTGTLLSTILLAEKALDGILLDLPDKLPAARTLIEASGLADRCTVMGGDFFKEVPANCDLYILAHVLHDWSDNEAIDILRNCRRAIADSGRLLIIETIIPRGDEPHHGKLMDLLMLTVTGGRERTADEFGDLLAASDFRLARVIPTETHQSLLEVIPV